MWVDQRLVAADVRPNVNIVMVMLFILHDVNDSVFITSIRVNIAIDVIIGVH